MAAARQEFGRTPSLNKAVSPVRTSDDVDPVSSALAATDTAPRVIAIPQTSLLQPLQQLPVVGPLFVTPVVALIHQIPFVGDILHPIIGYPLGLTGGTTPRDVKVISFDGTPIYVHFFPATEWRGTQAPTILNGPAWAFPARQTPLLEGSVPAQRGHRDRRAAAGRLQRRHVGSARRMEFGRPARDRLAGIRGPRHAGDHQLAGSAARGPTRRAGNDPRIGMVGASYGGGIQLVTAAVDKRVDAIVPTIAWNNLNTSLYKSGAPKTQLGGPAHRGSAASRSPASIRRSIRPWPRRS